MDKAERIWAEYSRLILWIARGFFGDTPDAEDAASETVERILGCLDQFGEVPSPRSRTLCAVIAKNVCRDMLRRRKRIPETEAPPEEDEGSAEPSAEAVWFSAETVEEVKRCVARLPEAYADILRLKMGCRLSAKETAAALGISEGNARIRLYRARAALTKLMKEEGLL